MCFKSFAKIEKPQRKVWSILSEFSGNYLALVAKLRLNVKLLEPVLCVIDSVKQPINVFDPEQLSEEEQNEILKFEQENLLREDRPQLTVLKERLVVQCFSSGMFGMVVKMLTCNEGGMEPYQLALVLKIFRAIEPYLDENLVTGLLPYLAEEALTVLSEKKADFEGMCGFLTEFVKMVPEKVEQILVLFCSFMTRGQFSRGLQLRLM